MKKIFSLWLIIAIGLMASLTGCAEEAAIKEDSLAISMHELEDTEYASEDSNEAEAKVSLPQAEVSDQEMAIPYAGETFQKSLFAAGGSMLYIYGLKEDGSSFVGYMQKEEDYFQECEVKPGDNMRAFNMAVDGQNRCHILWMSVEEEMINGQSFDRITYDKSCITIVNQEGKLQKEIDVSTVFSAEQKRPFCFAVNEENHYYFENGNKLVEILPDGIQGAAIACNGGNGSNEIEGIGMGKSGALYCTYTSQDGTTELAKLQDGALLPVSAKLPPADAIYSGIYAGTDTELLLFNKAKGVFSYDGNAVEERVPLVEFPISGQMISGYGILLDGRICVITQEEGNTTFYYIPAGK